MIRPVQGGLIINVTPTGMIPTKGTTPHVPVSAAEVVQEVHGAVEIGVIHRISPYRAFLATLRQTPSPSVYVAGLCMTGVPLTHPVMRVTHRFRVLRVRKRWVRAKSQPFSDEETRFSPESLLHEVRRNLPNPPVFKHHS